MRGATEGMNQRGWGIMGCGDTRKKTSEVQTSKKGALNKGSDRQVDRTVDLEHVPKKGMMVGGVPKLNWPWNP